MTGDNNHLFSQNGHPLEKQSPPYMGGGIEQYQNIEKHIQVPKMHHPLVENFSKIHPHADGSGKEQTTQGLG